MQMKLIGKTNSDFKEKKAYYRVEVKNNFYYYLLFLKKIKRR